jgi:hypothetical protein
MKRRTAKKRAARARRWLAQSIKRANDSADRWWEHVQMAKEKLVHDAVMARLGDLEGQLKEVRKMYGMPEDGIDISGNAPVFVATGRLDEMVASVGEPAWVQADDCVTTIGVVKDGGNDGER